MDKNNKIARYEGLVQEQTQIVNNLTETSQKLDEDLDKAKWQLQDYQYELKLLKDDVVLKNLKAGTCYHKVYKNKTFSWEETKEFVFFIEKVGKEKMSLKAFWRHSGEDDSKFTSYKNDSIIVYNEIDVSKRNVIKDLLKADVEVISREDALAIVNKWLGL